MKKAKILIITTSLVVLGLFFTFLAIDSSLKIMKIVALILFLIGLAGLLIISFKMYLND